ncbi:type IV pilus modification PilV family protein [Nesterenkonia populi]|uniref:type IV pilus modification PilV family protein n=1 Tax=Nesterenkonia populi TaxID=1591087 RepID=UPI0011BD66C8|nr:type II secretion system protein [Nesterenkonia populi]
MGLTALRGLDRDDEGFGMVEVIISMMLIALLAVAMLPVMLHGLRASTVNTEATVATQVVNREMDTATAGGELHDCDTIANDWPESGRELSEEIGGQQRTVRWSAEYPDGPCGEGVIPVKLTVQVLNSSGTGSLAEASTVVRAGPL